MTPVKCAQCGLNNFLENKTCKRCNATLTFAAPPIQRKAPAKPAETSSSPNFSILRVFAALACVALIVYAGVYLYQQQEQKEQDKRIREAGEIQQKALIRHQEEIRNGMKIQSGPTAEELLRKASEERDRQRRYGYR